MAKQEKTCGSCQFYTGLGDWGLSCTNPAPEVVGWCGVLVYEDSTACSNHRDKIITEDSNCENCKTLFRS